MVFEPFLFRQEFQFGLSIDSYVNSFSELKFRSLRPPFQGIVDLPS